VPEVPEPLRVRSFVVVETFHLGDPAKADELLAPLRVLDPENDTIDNVPVQALTGLSLDPDHPVPVVGDGMLLAALPSEAIDRLVGVAGAGFASPLLSVELRQLGGELGRAKLGHGVLSSIDARYAMFRGRDRSHRGGGPGPARISRSCASRDGTVGGGEDVPELRRDPA
jgi:hypothetical protein